MSHLFNQNHNYNKKNYKKVSFSPTNQIITIDEIDEIMKSKYIPKPEYIEQSISYTNHPFFLRNIVLGVILFLFAIIFYFQLKKDF